MLAFHRSWRQICSTMLASILYDYGRFSVEVKSTLLLGAYVFLKYALKMDLVKGEWFDLYAKSLAQSRWKDKKKNIKFYKKRVKS